jgi:hypothetical protein
MNSLLRGNQSFPLLSASFHALEVVKIGIAELGKRRGHAKPQTALSVASPVVMVWWRPSIVAIRMKRSTLSLLKREDVEG